MPLRTTFGNLTYTNPQAETRFVAAGRLLRNQAIIQNRKYTVVHIEQISVLCAACAACAPWAPYPYFFENTPECTFCNYVHFVHPVHPVHPMIFGAIDSSWCIKVHCSLSSALLCILCTQCTLRFTAILF